MASDPPDPHPPSLPPGLAALRGLVTALTVVMIAGFVVLIGALVMRLTAAGPPLPPSVDLPDGSAPMAFTQGGDWFAVVTADDRILIYDRLTGRLRQEVAVE